MSERQSNVLVIDDDDAVRLAVRRVLEKGGFVVDAVADAVQALEKLRAGAEFDVILTDLEMPRLHGTDFLRLVREIDLDVPVVVMTGNPSLKTAIAVVEHGGFRYLQKPVPNALLNETLREASAMHRLAILKRQAHEFVESGTWPIGDRAGLDVHFDRALDQLAMAFQPIVKWPEQTTYGFEALVRSRDPNLNNPGLLFEAAERLDRVPQLGRIIRRAVASGIRSSPEGSLIFVNVDAIDLSDDELYMPSSALSAHASRVVLEVTERSSLHEVTNLRSRIGNLRSLGFRIAVDDLGAGYAGLSSFSSLEPDIVKLDMSLIRGINESARKASLVRSLISVCRNELDTSVICEGVETEAERDTLEDLGADLLQGFLFGRPEYAFSAPRVFRPAKGA